MMHKSFIILILAFAISIQANSQCENNNLVYPSNSTQEGIYKTNGTIESAGTINKNAKFMAKDRVILHNGFSVDKGIEFTTNNKGCTYNEDYCIESILNPYGTLSMFTPITYPNGGAFWGDDTWSYSSRSIIQDVVFSMEQGPGTPYSPATLTLPLPAVHNNCDQMELVYSASESGTINGVLYYKFTNFPFTNVQAVYLHKNDIDEYKEVLFIYYAEDKHEEVISILETVNGTDLDFSNCSLQTTNFPFVIQENEQYCLNDGLKITINEIENNLCCSYCDPNCICITNGLIAINMTIEDDLGSIENHILETEGEINVKILTHNNWEIALQSYVCPGYVGDITISVVNKKAESKTCHYVDFRYYQDEPLALGERSTEYIVIGSDSLNSNNEIAALIQSKNYFDQNYDYDISSFVNYPYKQIAVKLFGERNCNEITAIITDLKLDTRVDYTHFAMQTDDCQSLIWEPLGNLCINSYSSSFSVKVFDENDLTDLNNTIQETNTMLISQNQFMPKWFHLRANKNSDKDALQMANYFYETGLFEHSEPDIIKIPVE